MGNTKTDKIWKILIQKNSNLQWHSKFYPKRIIQINGVELSTQISHIKNYPVDLSKTNNFKI